MFKGTSHNNIEATFNQVFIQATFIPYFPYGKYYFDHGPDSSHDVVRDKIATAPVTTNNIKSEVGYCPPARRKHER